MKKVSPFWPLIIALAVLKFILPFVLQSPVYELQRDEYLYYQQGLHVDLGYLENPPLLSYLGMISSWLGGSVFWIKFWPSLFGALTVIFSCLLAVEFGGKRFAQLIAGLCIITGAFLRVHSLFQPNFLDIFFWTLSVYFLIRFLNEKQTKFLYAFTISLALGFWGKYSVLFFAASLVLALLISKHRKIFLEKKFYSATLIGLLIIIPNVWWQYNHNWPLIHHMGELQETQLNFINPADFIKAQFMMLIAVVVIWVGGLIWVLKQSQWRFVGYTYLFVIILLIAGRGKSYYSLGAYPMLLAAGAVAWEKWTNRKYWIRYVISIFIVGFTFLILPLLLPTRKPEQLAAFYKKINFKNKWEDQKEHPLPQDFADMLGWKELAEKAEKFYHSLPDTTESNTIIYCRNYGQAGALKFYGKEAWFKALTISDNGSFLLWIPARLGFKHILYIGRDMPDKDDEVFQHFEKVIVIDSVTNPLSRQLSDKIIFFENIDSTGLRLAREGLQQMKKKFNR